MFQRSWVRIPAPYTGWTFFEVICCKNCVLEKTKINEKEAVVGPFKQTKLQNPNQYNRGSAIQ